MTGVELTAGAVLAGRWRSPRALAGSAPSQRAATRAHPYVVFAVLSLPITMMVVTVPGLLTSPVRVSPSRAVSGVSHPVLQMCCGCAILTRVLPEVAAPAAKGLSCGVEYDAVRTGKLRRQADDARLRHGTR